MKGTAKNTLLGKWLIVFAAMILCVGMATTQALAVSYDSTGNNFTMIGGAGGVTGGTNDVRVTWDGTYKTSVVATGQQSNGTIGSSCPFFDNTWNAHDVAIYGPGTYTVNPCCPSGRPGCANTCYSDPDEFQEYPIQPITFTVGAGEIGGHMLFNWSSSANIDVVDVWTPNAVFAPSPMWDGSLPGGCGTNSAATQWSWMSKDWGSCGTGFDFGGTRICTGTSQVTDGFNGAPMVDGPFNAQNANFNWQQIESPCLEAQPADPDPPCVVYTCVNSVWTETNTTASCDADSNACTDDDTCSAGVCVAGAVLDCDDFRACTDDSCDPASGCTHEEKHCNFPTVPTLISPADGAPGQLTTLELRWTRSTDPNGDPITYHVTYCKTPDAEGCPSVVDIADTTVAKRDNQGVFYAGGAGLLMIGMTFIGGWTGRKKVIVLLVAVLFTGGAFLSCKNTKDVSQYTPLADTEINYMATGLDPGSTYYWKVEADDGYGEITKSETRTFSTQ